MTTASARQREALVGAERDPVTGRYVVPAAVQRSVGEALQRRGWATPAPTVVFGPPWWLTEDGEWIRAKLAAPRPPRPEPLPPGLTTTRMTLLRWYANRARRPEVPCPLRGAPAAAAKAVLIDRGYLNRRGQVTPRGRVALGRATTERVRIRCPRCDRRLWLDPATGDLPPHRVIGAWRPLCGHVDPAAPVTSPDWLFALARAHQAGQLPAWLYTVDDDPPAPDTANAPTR